MKKSDHIEYIVNALQTLEPLRKRLSLGFADEGIFGVKRGDEEKFTYEETEEAYKWLMSIMNLEGRNAVKAYNYLPEKIWKTYENFDTDGFEEVINLKKTTKTLRARLCTKSRPAVFKAANRKDKSNDSETDESSVRDRKNNP